MIERKYKIENNRLVRRADGVPVPDDEPLFIFRAQDRHALSILTAYNCLCRNLDYKANVTKSIKDFQAFAEKFPERMIEPGS